MHKGVAWGMGLGVVVLAAVALVGPAKVKMNLDGLSAAARAKPAASAPVALEFQPAELVRPQRLALSRVLEFSGPLVAPDTAVVRAKAAGTLSELKVQEGSPVRAGQLLGRLDLPDLASRLAEREAALASAQVGLNQAIQTHASNERLAAQQFISTQALANSQSALDSARAQVNQVRASLATTRVGAREAALLAPISGIVSKRHAVPGEKVAPEQPLLTIVDVSRLELAGAVGTHEVAGLAPGMPVQVKVEGAAAPLSANLARIAPAAEPGTRSIGVAVAVPNPGQRLRAGSYAVARVVLPGAQPHLTLPLSAVAGSTGAPAVWVLDAGRLQRRSVTLGSSDEASGRVEVLSGLPESAQVLAQRFDNLRDGAPARVAPAPPGK